MCTLYPVYRYITRAAPLPGHYRDAAYQCYRNIFGHQITRKWDRIELHLQSETGRKSYMIYIITDLTKLSIRKFHFNVYSTFVILPFVLPALGWLKTYECF